MRLLVLAGAFAAIAALFGGPLVAALMLLELLAISGARSRSGARDARSFPGSSPPGPAR